MNYIQYENKGYIGLANLGNTCFLNSCIQILNHTYELHFLIDNKIQNKHVKPNCIDTTILNEWNELTRIMWMNSGSGTVSPNKFIHSIQKVAKEKKRDVFTGWLQNDITEFLLFLLDCIHNSISRKIKIQINGNVENQTDKMAVAAYELLQTIYSKEYSEIMDIFYGVYVTTLSSLDGRRLHSIKAEHYFVLDLQIFHENRLCKNLYECFDLLVKPEQMTGENAWYNEKTKKKQDISKTMCFWNFPKILVVTLKRFSPDGMYKINSVIDFPLVDLDLSAYVKGYNSKNYVYDLFGVCNHMGGVEGGHYTSFVKNVSGKWVHYNDTVVEIVADTDIHRIVSPMSYCLFYRKKNNLS